MMRIQLDKFISKLLILIMFTLMIQMMFAEKVSHQNEFQTAKEDLLENSLESLEEKSLNTRQQVTCLYFDFKRSRAFILRMH
jgi:hypothetical protein